MHEDELFWPSWAQFLQEKGVKEIAATLLEGAGPLRILASQIMYSGMPFFGSHSAANQWQAFADLLEDQEKTDSFISFLRGEVSK
jgi:hypothetical protein